MSAVFAVSMTRVRSIFDSGKIAALQRTDLRATSGLVHRSKTRRYIETDRLCGPHGSIVQSSFHQGSALTFKLEALGWWRRQREDCVIGGCFTRDIRDRRN